MKLLTGNSNKVLSKNIAKYLKTKLVNSSIRKFADGEVYVEINENIRGNSIFIIQSISSPANDNLMELLLCIDALKRSSAKNITAVIPYFGYARQDRKVVPRTSISAKLVSNLITFWIIPLKAPFHPACIAAIISFFLSNNRMGTQSAVKTAIGSLG